jgi:hypothetical protein
MKVRPTSVMVVAWLLIAANVIVLLCDVLALSSPKTRALMENRSLPISVSYFMMFGGRSLMIASGIGMLKGQNWARFLYVIWWVIASLVAIATSTMTLRAIPGVVVFLCFVFFLFRPNASQFFLATGPVDTSHGGAKTTRTVLLVMIPIALLLLPLILTLILSGFDLLWNWLLRVALSSFQ